MCLTKATEARHNPMPYGETDVLRSQGVATPELVPLTGCGILKPILLAHVLLRTMDREQSWLCGRMTVAPTRGSPNKTSRNPMTASTPGWRVHRNNQIIARYSSPPSSTVDGMPRDPMYVHVLPQQKLQCRSVSIYDFPPPLMRWTRHGMGFPSSFQTQPL